jgi:hypothetical protein
MEGQLPDDEYVAPQMVMTPRAAQGIMTPRTAQDMVVKDPA